MTFYDGKRLKENTLVAFQLKVISKLLDIELLLMKGSFCTKRHKLRYFIIQNFPSYICKHYRFYKSSLMFLSLKVMSAQLNLH